MDRLARAILDGPQALAVAALVSDPRNELIARLHLDDEAMAAYLEGGADARSLAHLVVCPACRARCAELERLSSLVPLHPDPTSRSKVPLPTALLFATVRAGADGAFELLQASGTARVSPSLAVRGSDPAAGARTHAREPARSMEGVSLRDRADAPALEVAIVREPDQTRASVLVRWLRPSSVALLARVSRAGRLLAEADMVDGSAVLAGLRLGDLRIDVVAGTESIGVGWLHLESP